MVDKVEKREDGQSVTPVREHVPEGWPWQPFSGVHQTPTKGKPLPLPKGWENCPICLFFSFTRNRNPGHKSHRSGLPRSHAPMLHAPPAKLKASTIPKCEHGVFDPHGDGASCEACRTKSDTQTLGSGSLRKRLDSQADVILKQFGLPREAVEGFAAAEVESEPAKISGQSTSGLECHGDDEDVLQREPAGELVGHVDYGESLAFQTHSIRRPERKKPAPDFMSDDSKLSIYALHLNSSATGDAERKNMARAFACIYLYHRNGMSVPEIADWLGMTRKQAENFIARRTARAASFFERRKKRERERAERSDGAIVHED